jgi:predicted ArsR family transcriptional regulator
MPESGIEAVGVLHEPLRRAAYERAIASGGPVSRNEVADALGIGRTLAAHHLDRLAEAGLLEVSFARLTGRSGPGAGRPAKLYRRARTEHSFSLPPRDYKLLAEILADAVEAAGAEPALAAAARRRGRAEAARLEEMARLEESARLEEAARLKAMRPEATDAATDEATDPGAGGDARGAGGDAPDARVGKLRQLGYEPYVDGDVVRLRNCPFDGVARANPPVACGASLAFIEGLCGPGARLDPRRDGCCVVLAAAATATENGRRP